MESVLSEHEARDRTRKDGKMAKGTYRGFPIK